MLSWQKNILNLRNPCYLLTCRLLVGGFEEIPQACRSCSSPPALCCSWNELGAAALFANFCIWTMLFVSALLNTVYEGSSGSSGTSAKYLSSARLKFKSGVFVISLICFGIALNSLAPCTGRLASNSFCHFLVWSGFGTEQKRPRRMWVEELTWPLGFGTRFSKIFQIYIIL